MKCALITERKKWTAKVCEVPIPMSGFVCMKQTNSWFVVFSCTIFPCISPTCFTWCTLPLWKLFLFSVPVTNLTISGLFYISIQTYPTLPILYPSISPGGKHQPFSVTLLSAATPSWAAVDSIFKAPDMTGWDLNSVFQHLSYCAISLLWAYLQ